MTAFRLNNCPQDPEMLWHYPMDTSLKSLPKIQHSIRIFAPNSNFMEVDSQYSAGIPLGAEEDSDLGVLSPPGHTQGFGSAGGRSPIKNLPLERFYKVQLHQKEYGTWNVAIRSQNCFFFTHWMLNIFYIFL